MTDRNDVIAEAKILLDESKHLPMSTVLHDYIAYLNSHPDVYKNAELSQTMSSNIRSILPDLVVADVQDTASDANGSLTATEGLDDLKNKANLNGGQTNPYSELAKFVLKESEFLREAGAVSVDGKTMNLDALRIESSDGKHLLTTDTHTLSQECLADGTILWRKPDNTLVAAQYENGMVVKVEGNDAKPISSQDDLATSAYVPTEVIYPNGSSIFRDPDFSSDPKQQWFFTDANSGITYSSKQLTWDSTYFQSLKDNYVVPIESGANENISRQATFSADGRLVILTKTVFNSDLSVNQAASETIDSINKVLKIANEPAYRYAGDHWEVQKNDGTWKPTDEVPSITSQGSYLSATLPMDPGGQDRGKEDLFPGGRHLGYYADGAAYDLDNQRAFAGNVQVYYLHGATSHLNIPGQTLVPNTGVVVLPDLSTIQTDDYGQWTHYAYAANPQNPLSKGAVLGLVGQPIIDDSSSQNPQIYFQTDNPDAPPVPFSQDTQARTYTLQVGGSQETFAYGGDLTSVKRRDNSIIEFSTTKPIRPIRISFKNANHTPDVDVSDVVFDTNTEKWMRTVTQNGSTITTEVQVQGLDPGTNFESITITNADGSQDIFPPGGLPSTHKDAPLQATSTAANQGKTESVISGKTAIVLDGSTPVAITLDDSELATIGMTPMLSKNSNAVKITIPADKIAVWKSESNHSNISFNCTVEGTNYAVTISSDLKTITITAVDATNPYPESEVFTAQGVQQNNSK